MRKRRWEAKVQVCLHIYLQMCERSRWSLWPLRSREVSNRSFLTSLGFFVSGWQSWTLSFGLTISHWVQRTDDTAILPTMLHCVLVTSVHPVLLFVSRFKNVEDRLTLQLDCQESDPEADGRATFSSSRWRLETHGATLWAQEKLTKRSRNDEWTDVTERETVKSGWVRLAPFTLQHRNSTKTIRFCPVSCLYCLRPGRWTSYPLTVQYVTPRFMSSSWSDRRQPLVSRHLQRSPLRFHKLKFRVLCFCSEVASSLWLSRRHCCHLLVDSGKVSHFASINECLTPLTKVISSI